MKAAKDFIVRVVKSTNKPFLHKQVKLVPFDNPHEDLLPYNKHLNVATGSIIGFAAGLIIYLMLKSNGLTIGNLESSIIVGLPSFLGVVTSLVTF